MAKGMLIFLSLLFIHLSVSAQKIHRTYHKNGSLEEEGIYDEQGRKSGEWKIFYEDGQLNYRANFVNNKVFGAWNVYFPDGRLRILGHIDENGADTDTFVQYEIYPYYEVLQSGCYNQGKQVGEWKYYYPDGKLMTVQSYENGVLHGKMTRYGENGQLISLKNMKNGVTVGVFEEYYLNGKLRIKGNYDTKEAQYYDAEGNEVELLDLDVE